MSRFERVRTLPGLALVAAVGCGPDHQNEAPADIDRHGAAGTPARELDDPTTSAGTHQDETPTDPGTGAEPQHAQTPSDEAPPPTTIRTLQLSRRGALGFCIDDGQFLTAQIATGADGLMKLSGQVHRGWNDPAVTGCQGQACERLEEVGPIQPSSAQQGALELLANQLPDGGCQIQASRACDPCVVLNLTVNGATFGGDPCTLGCSGSVDVVLKVGDSLDSWVSP
jgi:hypothetical protein